MSLNFKEDSDIKLQLEKYKNRVVDLEAISKKHQESQGQLIVQNNQLKKTIKKLNKLIEALTLHP